MPRDSSNKFNNFHHSQWLRKMSVLAPKVMIQKSRVLKNCLSKIPWLILGFWLSLSLSLSLGFLLPACARIPSGIPASTQNQLENQLVNPLRKPIELSIVSYAVTRAAYANIIPLFKAKWLREHNQEVRIRFSNAGSSIQTNAVINGLPTDVVHLALAQDISKIQKAGLIQPGWEQEVPNNGIVTRTVAVIVTRAGNPKKINTWADLGKPGISVVTADPKTSGIARWNFLAFWGSVTQTEGTEAQAQEFVTRIYKNVKELPKDARESTDTFLQRKQGDVLINYENELLRAAQEGLTQETSAVVPEVNISIDNPVAVVDKYVDQRGTRSIAEAFVQFLYTPDAQREFAKVGFFRPFDPAVAAEFADKYPPVKKLFTVEDFGGWGKVQERFFRDGGAFDQIQAEIGNK